MAFKKIMLNISLYSWIFMPSFSYATDITTDIGQGADTYIRGGPSANLNFGSEHVTSKNAGVSGMHVARKIYLRFDISEFSDVVENAKLHLVFRRGTGFDHVNNNLLVYGLNENIGQSWIENNITWNNAPANITTSPGALTSNASLLGVFSVPQGTVEGTLFSFSNSALVNFINNAQESVTLVLSAEIASDDGVSFYSKENTIGATAPTIELTAVPQPEPCEAPTVQANLDIHIPLLNYQSLTGPLYLWADFQYIGQDSEGELLWKLKDFGENQGSAFACITDSPVSVAPDLDFHMQSLNYLLLTGTLNLWANFEYYGQGNNGELLWKLLDHGENQ